MGKQNMSLTPLQRKLTNTVRQMRRSKGMSQLKLALSIGVSRSRISNIESGKASYSLVNLENISQVFHCSMKDFFPND